LFTTVLTPLIDPLSLPAKAREASSVTDPLKVATPFATVT
jgi:hypothetical protein